MDRKNTTFSELISKYRTELMGLSMTCIILYHQPWFTCNPILQLFQMLGYIGVEVFLLISGFGIAHSLQKNTIKVYYYNRFIRLFPVCFVAGVLKIIASLFPCMPEASSCFIWELIGISSWYVYAIVVYYLVAPLIRKFIERYGWTVLIVVSLVSYIVVFFWHNNHDAYFLVYFGRWIVKRMPVFVLGLTIAMRPLNTRPVTYITIGLLAIILNFVAFRYIISANASIEIASLPARWFVHLPNRTDIPDNGRYLLDMLSAVGLCPFFAIISNFLKKAKLQFVVIWLGTYSLEVYLCHQYIFEAYNLNIDMLHLPESAVFSLAIVSTVIVSSIIHITAKTIKKN